jgi:hypothetical protein
VCIQKSLLITIDNTRKCHFCHQIFILDLTSDLFILQTSSSFIVPSPNDLQTRNFPSNNNHILQKIIENNENDLEIKKRRGERKNSRKRKTEKNTIRVKKAT